VKKSVGIAGALLGRRGTRAFALVIGEENRAKEFQVKSWGRSLEVLRPGRGIGRMRAGGGRKAFGLTARILRGDCRVLARALAANSIDTLRVAALASAGEPRARLPLTESGLNLNLILDIGSGPSTISRIQMSHPRNPNSYGRWRGASSLPAGQRATFVFTPRPAFRRIR